MMTVSPTYLLTFLPLLVAISIVFASTRHESPQKIRQKAFGTARWIAGFMLVIFLVLTIYDFFG